jgi:hypothetical protein
MPVPVGGSSSLMAQAEAISVLPRVGLATAPASLEYHLVFLGSSAPQGGVVVMVLAMVEVVKVCLAMQPPLPY